MGPAAPLDFSLAETGRCSEEGANAESLWALTSLYTFNGNILGVLWFLQRFFASGNCSKDPELAKLFDEIAKLRSSYLNDQLQDDGECSDVENGREVDEEYFHPSRPPRSRASSPRPSAPVTPVLPKAPEVMQALPMPSDEPETPCLPSSGSFRSIPSLDGDLAPTPPTSPSNIAAPKDFQPPPDMTPAEKNELSKVLKKIAMLELKTLPGSTY